MPNKGRLRHLVGKIFVFITVYWLFNVAAFADSTDSPLYPRTEARLYGMTIWDEQSFLFPLTQATIRHREKNWYLWTKYDLGKNQLVELAGTYKPYRWLALQTGQFRTPVGYNIPLSEYHLFTIVPVGDIIPNTYDRGVMAIMTTDHTNTMVAGINGEGYDATRTDNEIDVAYRLGCRVRLVSATYSRQQNSGRRFSAGSVTLRDKYLTTIVTKAMRAGDYEASVTQLQLISSYWSPWSFGVQFSRFSKKETFQRGAVTAHITTNQSITDFALERRFGDLSRIRVECLPFDGADDQWRVTVQHGFAVSK